VLLKRLIIAFFLLLTVIKVMVADHIDLFSDEAFYWQCGQRLDIHFADLPFMTAFLVRLGTEIVGDSLLGVRLIFLLLGVILPLAIYLLAKPIVGGSFAWMSAGLFLSFPFMGMLGLMAVPDVIIILLTAVFLLGFEHATRMNTTGWWLLTGLSAAAGLSTHYRFILAPFSAFLYLLATRHGRRQWKRGGLWLAIIAMLPGFLPTAIYNLRTGWKPISYFTTGRHGLEIHPMALLDFLAKQMLFATPLLFAALLWTLFRLIKRAHTGDNRAGMLLLFSLVPLGLFFFASPLHDTRLIKVHWPMPAYIPLLVYLPETLESFAIRSSNWIRRVVAILTPGIGAALVLIILFEIGTGYLGVGLVQKHIYGWSLAVNAVQEKYMDDLKTDQGELRKGRPVIIADNYILAANLEFRLHEEADVYTLDHKINSSYGRSAQFEIWGTGEAGLRKRSGEDALVVVQLKEVRAGHREKWMAHVSSLFEHLKPLGELSVKLPARRSLSPSWAMSVEFQFYRGHAIRPKSME
jgi:4-amino-4-deoxy-L-arabinose transferase-like glycosyltransferase